MKLLTPRRRRLLLFAVACALLATGWFWWTRPKPEITWENSDKIQAGMTEAEVIATLGVPAGDYTTGPRDYSLANTFTVGFGVDSSTQYIRSWEGDECTIDVAFEKETGKVTFRSCVRRHTVKTNWLERIKYRAAKYLGY